MVKKILFTYGHARAKFSWDMFGEIVSRLVKDCDSEVYWLLCGGVFKGHCWYSTKWHIGYCNKCIKPCLKIALDTGIKPENIIHINCRKSYKIPKFNSIQELIAYEYKGYNLGLSPASTIMTITRDYCYDIKKWEKYIRFILENECKEIDTIEALNSKIHFDEIHCFTGRTPTTYPLVSFAGKQKIPYYVYETGSKPYKLCIDKDSVRHDFYHIKDMVKQYWQIYDKNKDVVANRWFIERRAGKFQAMESFTKDQMKGLLPAGFNSNIENISIFNSSIDEIYAFDCWKHSFADNENQIIEGILEHYSNDNSKHFYLRVHPNLIKAKRNNTTQIREINNFKKRYDNLTVIEPDEKIDTYALIEASDKVITAFSTTACEATYWGTPAILAGKAPYEDLDCVYIAKSMDELFDLIDTKNLISKSKINTLPYGYYNETYGEDYKYYKKIHCIY